MRIFGQCLKFSFCIKNNNENTLMRMIVKNYNGNCWICFIKNTTYSVLKFHMTKKTATKLIFRVNHLLVKNVIERIHLTRKICFKLVTKTLGKDANLIHNKNTRITSLKSFWSFYCQCSTNLTYFQMLSFWHNFIWWVDILWNVLWELLWSSLSNFLVQTFPIFVLVVTLK